MQTAVHTVRSVAAFEGGFANLCHLQDTLVAAAGHLDDTKILDIEEQGLLTEYAADDADREVVPRNTGDLLATFIHDREVVVGFGLGLIKLAAETGLLDVLDAFLVVIAANVHVDVIFVLHADGQTPEMVKVLVADEEGVDLVILEHLVNTAFPEAFICPLQVPAGIEENELAITIKEFNVEQGGVSTRIVGVQVTFGLLGFPSGGQGYVHWFTSKPPMAAMSPVRVALSNQLVSLMQVTVSF